MIGISEKLEGEEVRRRRRRGGRGGRLEYIGN